MDMDQVWTRVQGHCKHSRHSAYETLGLVQVFEVASEPLMKSETGYRLMSMPSSGDAMISSVTTGHLVMVGQGYVKPSVGLEQVNASLQ